MSTHRFLTEPHTVAIVGCPFSGGQPRPGVDKGPIHLVNAGLVDQLKSLGWAVEFAGHHLFEDISVQGDPPVGIVKRPRLVSGVTSAVSQIIGGHAAQGRLPLTIGGDHSLALGTILGTFGKYPNACLIWIDAHADINTATTTDSGNLHGMPVSLLLGLPGNESIEDTYFSWLTQPGVGITNGEHNKPTKRPVLTPAQLVYIGLRDVDAGERAILRQNGIKAFSMHEVDKFGIGKVMEMALDHVNPNRDLPIHLSFDVDALDPSVAPSTGTPVRGGLTFREGHYICEAIHETGLLVGLDIMEVNPSLEDEGSVQQTVKVGCSLARAALGETLL
ncbi:hypothetical protein BS47DRAFT_1336355 [Hydnum rufescens UP504]|uniref:Arginase n=1 Tax=Hydnum rufescens UP504 TaxID=1448309 RepID=A0A9P6E1X7_9AGAM|nr:hypothetical protein BS47DRAFT_1336355 [Hydnum rufescens UP504]